MKYQVTFKVRTNAGGQPENSPAELLDRQLPDGVVLDKALVAGDEPQAMHNEEDLEEDDDFLSIGTETWEYDIAEGHESEFMDAVAESELALEGIPLDGSPVQP